MPFIHKLWGSPLRAQHSITWHTQLGQSRVRVRCFEVTAALRLQVVIAGSVLVSLAGASALCGVVVIIAVIPISRNLAKRLQRLAVLLAFAFTERWTKVWREASLFGRPGRYSFLANKLGY